MTTRPNVLWIMADQLRFDYLSCYGHPHLHTPHIDALAKRGVQFNKAYIQSPVCGPSRMSAYTGRYVRSHGSTWNGMPLRVGEPTLGDHLRAAGARAVLVGKTHMTADMEGMAWLGIDPNSTIGVSRSECGFDPYERDDGLHPDSARQKWSAYDDYLVENGFKSENPWGDFANSGLDENGERLSAWLLKNSRLPADVPEEHSETAYMTNRAIDFMTEATADGRPWMCHLSYIKPHWPYIVPKPYHDMYGPEHVMDPVRSDAERDTDHPLMKAYLNARVCRSFARDHVREHVIPAYMGLIKQLDDNLGRLFAWMDKAGLSERHQRVRIDQVGMIRDRHHTVLFGDPARGGCAGLFHRLRITPPPVFNERRVTRERICGVRFGQSIRLSTRDFSLAQSAQCGGINLPPDQFK